MKTTIRLFPIVLAFLCLSAVGPKAHAVSPPPDGGYPGFNTAEGTNALKNLTNGVGNTAVGWFSLFSNTDGSFNTAVGAGTLLFNTADQNTALGAAALLSNTTGFANTAVGVTALLSNTQGSSNTATGYQALQQNTSGSSNTANGYQALLNNTEGGENTAVGVFALLSNITGHSNTATGDSALQSNISGDENTAHGHLSLLSNTEGSANTATGSRALRNNTTGLSNTADGVGALELNSTGQQNTAIGVAALQGNTTANQNTATGFLALWNNSTGNINTAIGHRALMNNTGAGNTALGYDAGINLSIGADNICIAADGIAGEGGTIRIGRSFIGAAYIAGIFGQTASGGAQVFVNSDGKLGTSTSSRRFKHEMKPMGKTSETLFALKPVIFHYKKEIDPAGTPQFGLIAEDVEKVNSALIVRDKEGKPYGVRYDQVNAMLLNEFLKEHRKVEKLGATLSDLATELRQLRAQVQMEHSPQVAISNR